MFFLVTNLLGEKNVVVSCLVSSLIFLEGLNTDMTLKSCFSPSGTPAIPLSLLMKHGQDQTALCAFLSLRIGKCV